MPSNLGRYYFRATFIPGCVSAVAFWLFRFIDEYWGPGKDYKSEWLTADSLDGIAFLMVLGNGIIIALLATTLLMNGRDEVRGNWLLSFLAWFGAPIFYMIWITSKTMGEGYEEDGFVLCCTLPYLVALVWTFFQFRQALRVAAFANETGPLAD